MPVITGLNEEGMNTNTTRQGVPPIVELVFRTVALSERQPGFWEAVEAATKRHRDAGIDASIQFWVFDSTEQRFAPYTLGEDRAAGGVHLKVLLAECFELIDNYDGMAARTELEGLPPARHAGALMRIERIEALRTFLTQNAGSWNRLRNLLRQARAFELLEEQRRRRSVARELERAIEIGARAYG